MRNLKNNSEVAHAWANQTHESGKGSNFYFDGPVIYSYGPHFPIAKIHTINGRDIVLYSTRTYSSTTHKHQAHTRRACSHLEMFTVPSTGAASASGEPDHGENIQYLIDLMNETAEKARRAIKHGRGYIDAAEIIAGQINAYCEIFDIKQDPIPEIFTPEEKKKIKDKSAQYEAAEKERQARRLEKQRAEEAADLDAWTRGEPVGRTFYASAVRLRIKGDHVETSHGARVFIGAAASFLAHMDTGGNIQDYDLDGYTVQGWEDDILIIGCHEIPAAEVEKVREYINNQVKRSAKWPK